MKLNIFVSSLMLLSFPFYVNASSSWVDTRYAHITGAETNQYKIGVGHEFDSGAVFLASSLYDMGKDFNQFKSSFQEFEGWYPIRLSDNWSVVPGALMDVNSAGTKIAGSVMLNHKLSNKMSIAERYRYNHMTHRENDLNQVRSYNDVHQLDLFINYQATNNFKLFLNPQYNVNTGNFKAPNGRKAHWENNLGAQYWMSKKWMPYTELAWLDRDKNHDNQFRIRIGIKYFIP